MNAREYSRDVVEHTPNLVDPVWTHEKNLGCGHFQKNSKIYVLWSLSISTWFPEHGFKHFPLSELSSKKLTISCRISFFSPKNWKICSQTSQIVLQNSLEVSFEKGKGINEVGGGWNRKFPPKEQKKSQINTWETCPPTRILCCFLRKKGFLELHPTVWKRRLFRLHSSHFLDILDPSKRHPIPDVRGEFQKNNTIQRISCTIYKSLGVKGNSTVGNSTQIRFSKEGKENTQILSPTFPWFLETMLWIWEISWVWGGKEK